MSENPTSGVNVRDNRMFNPDGSLRDGAPVPAKTESPAKESPPRAATPSPSGPTVKDPAAAQKSRPQDDPEPGDIDFPTFILSLASSVQISMGLVPNPMTGEVDTDLGHAKQTIDILGMLEEKTSGNLAPEESGLLKQILYQLRMQYVELSKSPR